jgi:hypothetical protein
MGSSQGVAVWHLRAEGEVLGLLDILVGVHPR